MFVCTRGNPPGAGARPIRAAGAGQCRSVPTAIAGTPTGDYIGATDLCSFVEFPVNCCRCAGTASPVRGVGFGGWYAPVALHVDTESIDDPAGVRFPPVSPASARRCWRSHAAWRLQLPAGVVQINRTIPDGDHHQDLQPARDSRPVGRGEARRQHEFVSGSRRNAAYRNGRQTQISGYHDPVPTRPIRQLGGSASWPTASPVGAGGAIRPRNRVHRPVPLAGLGGRPRRRLEQAADSAQPDQLGEMSIHQIDGQTVLSYFNASTGNMEFGWHTTRRQQAPR